MELNRGVKWKRGTTVLRLAVAMALYLALFLFHSGASAETTSSLGALPWQKGDHLAKDWQISKILRQEEYVRLSLTKARQSTEIEISYAREPGSPWEVGGYRLQPAPGATPPPELLAGILAELKKQSGDAKNAPFVKKHESPAIVTPRAEVLRKLEEKTEELADLGSLYLLLALVAILLAIVLSRCWMRLDPTLRWLIPLMYGLMALLILLFVFVISSKTIPIGWITVMHEGQGYGNILQIYGQEAHTGTGYREIIEFFLPHSATALRDMVWFNLLLAGINVLLFFVIARFVTHTFWLAVPLAALFVFNPFTVSSAVSGLPSQSLSFLILLGACAIGLYHHRQAPPRAKRAAAVLLILVSALAIMTRSEFALIALITMAMLLPKERYGEEWTKRLVSRICAWCRTLIAWPAWRKVLFVAVVIAAFFAYRLIAALPVLASPLIVLRLFNLAFLSSPIVLGSLLPIGVIVLCLLGLSYTLRHTARFLFLPISIILMYNLYADVSHGTYFEIVRYLTYIIPLFFLLALFGWRELKWIAARMKWPATTWRPLAIVLLALLFISVPVHMRYRDFGNPDGESDMPFFGLRRNQQISVRYLLTTLESNPQCTLVSRVIRGRDSNAYELLFFGADFPIAKVVSYNDQPITEMVRKYVPAERRCVLLYNGLDCNRVAYESCERAYSEQASENCRHVVYRDCESLHEGLTLFDELSFRSVPYSNEEEFGHFASQVNLRLYWVPRRAD